MKKTLISIMACLTLSGVGHAQVSDMTLGYCAGELPAKGEISFSEADSYVEAAIYIPAGTINTFAGNEITGIRAGLASKLNIDELTVWLRNTLDGENLAEETITRDTDPKIKKGWNELYFSTPYTITDGNTTGLYIGYTYHQKGSAFGVAAINTPCNNAFWVKFGNGEWEDRSASGTLSIEGLVRGENLPKINLTLSYVEIPAVYIIDRGTMNVTGTIKNVATHTVTGFDVIAQIDGLDVASEHVDATVAYNENYNFNVTLKPGITELGDGQGRISIRIDNITEGADEDPSDNIIEKTFMIVEHDYTRRILVEEFTTEQCPNCPRVGGYMHNALAKDAFKEDVIAVCHHAGYYTDWLTTSFDANYLWLFNQGGSTYAPALMTDRKVYAESSPVYCPTWQQDMENDWTKRLAEPAFVSVNITADYDANDSNKLIVKVDGSKSMPELCDNPTITVFLVEDDIAARSQAGAGSDYIHYHVNRAVNSVWGDEVTFEGDDYTYECEFALSDLWNRDNMQIVAFIANYNEEDATDCEVQNANRLYFSQIGSSAVEEIATEDNAAEIYTLTGVKMTGNTLAPGIYIVKQGSTTKKIMVK